MLFDRVSGPLPENVKNSLLRRIDRAFDVCLSTPPACWNDPHPIFPGENPYPWRILWTEVDVPFINENYDAVFFIDDIQQIYYVPAFLKLWINDPWSEKLERGVYDFFALEWLGPSFDIENGRLICYPLPECCHLTEDQAKTIAIAFYHLWKHSNQSLGLEHRRLTKVAEFDQDIGNYISNKEDRYHHFRPQYDLTWVLALYWHRHLPARLRWNRVLAEFVVEAERRVEFREKAPVQNQRKR